jgi:hypothetical protein
LLSISSFVGFFGAASVAFRSASTISSTIVFASALILALSSSVDSLASCSSVSTSATVSFSAFFSASSFLFKACCLCELIDLTCRSAIELSNSDARISRCAISCFDWPTFLLPKLPLLGGKLPLFAIPPLLFARALVSINLNLLLLKFYII